MIVHTNCKSEPKTASVQSNQWYKKFTENEFVDFFYCFGSQRKEKQQLTVENEIYSSKNVEFVKKISFFGVHHFIATKNGNAHAQTLYFCPFVRSFVLFIQNDWFYTIVLWTPNNTWSFFSAHFLQATTLTATNTVSSTKQSVKFQFSFECISPLSSFFIWSPIAELKQMKRIQNANTFLLFLILFVWVTMFLHIIFHAIIKQSPQTHAYAYNATKESSLEWPLTHDTTKNSYKKVIQIE